MALVPIISQSWDTSSYVTPTRMNNIETNIGIVSNATGVKYAEGVSVKDMLDKVAVSVSASKSDVSIRTNRSYRIGNLLCLIVKGTSTNAHAQDILFTIDGGGTIFNCQEFTFGVPKGNEWGINGTTYGYIASNGGVIINNSAGDYFHINIAVPITLL